MKKRFLFVIAISFLLSRAQGQEFNKSIDKDSLLQIIIKDLPEEKKADVVKMYQEGNEESREFMLFMLTLPMSSKKEMKANIDSNFDKINFLKTEYARLVPKKYVVSIEFNPASKIAMTEESIDLRIKHDAGGEPEFKQEWNLSYDSEKLAELIKPLNWNTETLKRIKRMLADAHCVSIENGEITTIGFARSGMGKYFFKLFEKDLTAAQIEQYNGGCTFIFYKKNIVLEYGGGAFGPQCFPD